MCGRYTLTDPDAVAAAMLRDFGVVIPTEINRAPRYNVAPSQPIPIIHRDPASDDGRIFAEEMRWGLIPFWEKSEKPKLAPINCRSEDMFGKPMFRQALQRRRALFVADGFFEWQKPAPNAAANGPKTPFHIQVAGGAPFVIAGIYEAATTLRPEPTCALLTTAPNELMAKIHNRMPVILDAAVALRWLRPGPITPEELAAYCRPYPAAQMTAHPISILVNNVRNDGPEIVMSVDR
jgi:putative SOS response-associated peptidase YedK